ncbi:MAG: ATP-binding protein [Lewinellaceae bacterium]|nr:ATP-binding protein [Lewinellaceae bacterium]
MKIYRYPGVRPFEAGDSALFFGRDRDIADLYEMVRAERLVVLFGKSGYGKSSLLNAGVLPRLAGEMTPVEVRLGEYIAGQSFPPAETVQRKTPLQQRLQPEAAFLGRLPPTLWTHFKQLDSAEKGSYLLVFDQFEEFFSYPPEQQRAFRDQLADLLNGEPPEELREAARTLDREQRRLLTAPMDIRVLFAIRSDRMHEMDRLKDRLPAILHKRYELKALSRDQAREAIVQPALLGSSEAVTWSHRLTTEDSTKNSSFTTPHSSFITHHWALFLSRPSNTGKMRSTRYWRAWPSPTPRNKVAWRPSNFRYFATALRTRWQRDWYPTATATACRMSLRKTCPTLRRYSRNTTNAA